MRTAIETMPPEYATKGAQRGQTGGSHYQLPIQPVDYIVKNNLGYREGSVVKYVTRHKSKNGREDILKAIDFLNMILEDYVWEEEKQYDS